MRVTSAPTWALEDLEVDEIFRASGRPYVPDHVVEADHGKPYPFEDPLVRRSHASAKVTPLMPIRTSISHRCDAHLEDEVPIGEVLLPQIRERRTEVT